MAFLVGTESGGAFVATSPFSRVYDPVYDTTVDTSFIYKNLPSYFGTLYEDKDLVKNVWDALLQTAAGALLTLWETDAARSLKTLPVGSQKKWLKFDFMRDYDFATDPQLATLGIDNASYSQETESLVGTWTGRAGQDRSYIDLRAPVDEDTSLAFTAQLSLSSLDARGGFVLGFFSSEYNRALRSSLGVGVFGDSSGNPVAYLGFFNSAGVGTYRQIGQTLDLDRWYEFSFTYSASDDTARLTVTDLLGEKLSGTGTVETSEEPYTNTLTYASSLEGVVSVNDTLTVLGREYNVESVDGSTLTVSPAALPSNSTVPFVVNGPVVVGSVSLNLVNEAPSSQFSVDQFGVSNLDTRVLNSTIFSTPGLGNRKKCTLSTRLWSFSDPSFTDLVLQTPRLQNTPLSPTQTLIQNQDYMITRSDASATFKFLLPPTESLWAEYSIMDEGRIYDNFAVNVGLAAQPDSEAYRGQARGLYYSYLKGPTVESLRTGVHAVLGLPLAESAGTVTAINPDYSGLYGSIVIDNRAQYLYPLSLTPLVSVGDTVTAFQRLCDGVTFTDYLTDPTWFLGTSLSEIEKFHTFRIEVDTDIFDYTNLLASAQFVNDVKATWRRSQFGLLTDISDTINISDEISFLLTISLWDVPGTHDPLVIYDSYYFEGTGAAVDFAYDQGLTDWDSTTAAMRQNATVLTGTVTLTSASAALTGTGTLFTSEVAPAGPTTNTYLLFGLVTTGTAGVTSTSNTFTDATVGAFSSVEVGDVITVSGEGDFHVVTVTDANTLQLDGPTTGSNVAVTWSNSGTAKIWASLASVTNNTTAVLTAAFPNATGTYKPYLLDPVYFQAQFDLFWETFPEEEFTLTGLLSPGYSNTTMLSGRVSITSGLTTLQGDADTLFVAEIGSGAVVDKYLIFPDGSAYKVASVTDTDTLVMSDMMPATFSNVKVFLATTVMAPTITFTNGATSATLSSTVGAPVAGDFIQGGWSGAGTKVTPTVEISTVVLTAVTLALPYTGDSGTYAILFRGDSTIFPLSQDLPDSISSVVTLSFTDYDTGGEITSTVAER